MNPCGPDRTFMGTSMVVRTVLEGVTRGPIRALPRGQTHGGTRG